MALKPLFFYGTLRHLPLLEVVLGHSAQDMDLIDAHLQHHAVYWAQDQPFPMIAEDAGSTAYGMLLRGVTSEDVSRLDYYEGGFAYDLKDIVVAEPNGAEKIAQVYFPKSGVLSKGTRWSLTDWERDWSDISVVAAREAMEQFGSWTARDLAVKLPMMRRRADAARAARARGAPDEGPPADKQVEVLSRTRVHSHFFALDRMVLRHSRYDGSMTRPLDREAVYAGHAAVVLPFDPVKDEVILVEQFRANLFALGDPNPWVIEAIAGLVDPGETPKAAAIREAKEEAGVEPTRMEQVSAAYSSTGSNTEFVTTFVALADFNSLSSGGGLDSEGEDIRRIILPFAEFAEGLRACRFRDAPLITAGLWLMLNRDRLRSSA